MLCSVALLPTVVCGTSFFINFIAIYYHASRAIPFGSMVREKWLLKFINVYWMQKQIKLWVLTLLGGCSLHCIVCRITANVGWNSIGKKLGRSSRLPMQSKCSSSANTREEMVHGTSNHCVPWWSLAVRIDLHWNVRILRDLTIWHELRLYSLKLTLSVECSPQVLHLHFLLGL